MQFSLQSLLKLIFVVSIFFALRAVAHAAGSMSEAISILHCIPPVTATAAATASIWGPKPVSWRVPTVAGGIAGTLAVLFLLVEIDWDLPAGYFQWDDPLIQSILVVHTLIAFGIGLGSGWLVTWFRTWW